MKVKDIKNGHKCRCINKDGVCFDVVIQRVEPINDDTFRLFIILSFWMKTTYNT